MFVFAALFLTAIAVNDPLKKVDDINKQIIAHVKTWPQQKTSKAKSDWNAKQRSLMTASTNAYNALRFK